MTHSHGKMNRVGPKMLRALQYAADYDGPVNKMTLAAHVVPGRLRSGKETVGRCLKQGLLAAHPEHPEWAIVLTDAGRAVLKGAN